MQQPPLAAALAVNKRLATVPDWPSFGFSHRDAASVLAAFADEPQGPQQALDLLCSVVPVLARGMELLAQQQLDASSLQQHARGMLVLRLLYGEWAHSTSALARMPSHADRDRVFVQLAVQATRTGMLKAYEQLCRALARFISSPGAQPQQEQQQQQQQQQQQAASKAATGTSALQESNLAWLIPALLWWLESLIVSWPSGKALSNPGVAAAVPAAAELAVAALRNKNAHWPAPRSSSSSSSGDGRGSVSERITGRTFQPTATAAASLAVAIYTASPPGADNRPALHVLPENVSGSSAVMQLMMCCLALATQAIHKQSHGLSAAVVGYVPTPGSTEQDRRQEFAVPPFHTQLQQALRLADSEDALLLDPQASPDIVVSSAMFIARRVRFEDRSSSSSSSSLSQGSRGRCLQSSDVAMTPEQQQPLVAGEAVDALLPPLLMALLECSALLAEGSKSVTCLVVMRQLLESCMGLDSIPEALVRSLPPAMLQLLLPVIRHVYAAAAGAPASVTFVEASGRVLLQLVICVVVAALQQAAESGQWQEDCTLRALAAVFLQQPQAYSALLEAVMRCILQEVWWLWPSQLGFLLATAADVSGDDRISLSIADQQQLFALLISCCKAVSLAAAADDAGTDEQRHALVAQALMTFTCNIFRAHPLLLPHSSSSSQGGTAAVDGGPSSSSSPSNQLVAHLLGRCLVSAGSALQLFGSFSSISISIRGLLFMATDCLTVMAEQLPQLSPALPDPLLQQLLDEQTALQQQVEAQLQTAAEAAANAAAGADAGLMPGMQQVPAAVSMGQQLQAFGAAVAAQVPLKHCCNHHSCTNISKQSELELVGGKSCVCGGCQAARYCSRKCQVAHYKGWHKAVCKRLQQQEEEEEGGHVA